MLDRHVWQRFAAVVLAALVISSINTSSPVSNGDGLGIITIQARRKAHQLSNLLDQQIATLMGLDINPNWVGEQGVADSLTYGIVEPDGTVPVGTNEDYSYPATSDRDKGVFPFFKVGKKKVTVKYANHGEKLYTKAVPLLRLAE